MVRKQGTGMGGIKNLLLEIEHLLDQGKSFAEVAQELEIPVHFVIEAAEISSGELAEVDE
jgi:predicted transposase YdaD